MNFGEVLSIVAGKWTGMNISRYDGIIVKKLEASNTLDPNRSTNQTHIAITGEQMDIFPFIYSEKYMNTEYSERDESIKKYYVISAPVYLFKDNVIGWCSKQELNSIGLQEHEKVLTHFCVFRSRRRGQADQIQLSLINNDGTEFVAFRKTLHVGDYLVLLKHKNDFIYDCIGIKERDAEGLKLLNNKFFHSSTTTVVKLDNLKSSGSAKDTEGRNLLFYGVPGCGKSYAVKKICSDPDVMERVVFHPDYTYSDFVGQVLPRLDKNRNIEYVFTPGPFTTILKQAKDEPEKMFYLVIEEINRGNAPAIFGEIFQLLDRDVTGKSEYGINNYDIANYVYDDGTEKVFIPSNLTILATMNTSDQNVFTLDTAFQRRWEMQMIPNHFDNEHADDLIEDSSVTWGAFATTVNDIVVDTYSEFGGSGDKRLGAYFARLNELSRNQFPEKVLKYLWDDAFRMNEQELFSEDLKSLDQVVETYKSASSDPLKKILNESAYKRMIEKTNSSARGHDEETETVD